MVAGLSTPRLAKMVSWKYAHLSAGVVSEDFKENHKRPISRCMIQNISEAVGEMACKDEFEMSYALPDFSEVVSHIVLSRDGATTPTVSDGYRETMVGTLSLYSPKGERMHSIYVGAAPEYGKKTFCMALNMEIDRIKKRYPKVHYIGIADGAKDNWSYLEPHTHTSILDFYHATERLGKVSAVMGSNETKRKQWLAEACHDLKHKKRGAALLLQELKAKSTELAEQAPEVLRETMTYFTNNLKRMNYADYQKMGYPIGSGVTEAACKTLVKQRFSASGMRWNLAPTQRLLLLRAIVLTEGRWEQFWKYETKKRA